MPESSPIRVLCVAATGQSGSTLLTRMLGELPGFFAAGEVGRIWDKGLVENIACSCGEPFRSCPFWKEVGERAFGGWDSVDGSAVARLRDSLAFRELVLPHPFALPFLAHPGWLGSYRRKVETYRGVMRPVYRAIHDLSGGRIIVDSMKIPSHVFLMTLHMQDMDVRLVHHTRDSRGFAYSNVKWVERQGTPDRGPFRNRRPPWKSAIRWAWFNAAFNYLRRRGVPTVRLRYEDLVRAPAAQLHRAASVMGIDVADGDLAFVHEDGVDLSPGHVPSGSRSRRTAGRLTLREDLEWIDRLEARDRVIVTVLTGPWLRRYGYSLAAPRDAAAIRSG